MSTITRRRLLGAAGAVTMGALAGCTGAGDEDDAETDEETADDTASTELSEVTVENLSREEHTVDVIIEFDGEVDHWSTHELDDETTGVSLERSWPESAGSVRLLARLDGEEIRQVRPEQLADQPCVNLTIVIRRDGTLQILRDTSSGSCEGADGAEAELEFEDDEGDNE